jgi:hypothetical protein
VDPDAQEVHVDSSTWTDSEVENRNVVFRPNDGPQTEFFASTEQEVLFGGAAGGGKSFALLADPLRYLSHPNCSALLLRRTTEELRELRWKSQELYPRAFPDIKWSERNQNWVMPSGGRLWMSFLDRDDDVLRYQGQAFNWVGFDELTQWASPFPWEYLRSRLRTTAPDLPLFMRASTNPGNVGAYWVKRMFIDPAPFNTPFPATRADTGEVIRYPETRSDGSPHPKAGQPAFFRKFIPSRLSDNPYLFNDGQYEMNLQSLSETLRLQLLEGDWDTMEGAAFPEFDRQVHVIEPYNIPDGWRKFRACDYGYGSYSAVVWFAIHPSGQLIVYRDLEVTGMTGDDLADLIADIEEQEGESVAYGMLDSSVWHERGTRGPTIGEAMQRRNLRWRPADRGKGSRIAGKNMLHRYLRVDNFTGEPGLVFFNTAVHCIEQIPTLPLDKNNLEDIDTNARDHIYDALRYGISSRPRPGHAYGQGNLWTPTIPRFDPLDPILGY